jgi:hypothetical protein
LAVFDDDHVWRQARDSEDHYSWHQDDDGNWIARLRVKGLKGSMPGLQFDPDLSVQWREHLDLHGYTPQGLVRAKPNLPLIFEANVGDIRAIRTETLERFYVAYTPMDDEPYGCAHVSVLLLLRKSQSAERDSLREDLSRLLECRYGTPSVPVPEGA